jgi:predicted RND superfamily exporter protein
LWDALGVLAVAGVIVLAFGLIMLLAAVDEERWWKRMKREHKEDAR